MFSFFMLTILAQVPSFDAASVKPHVYGARTGGAQLSCANGRFTSYAYPIDAAIWFAYDLPPYQNLKLPSWTQARDGVYDIEAKASGPVSEPQCRLMVQTLLADRFKLAVHRESKSTNVYALVVGKNGPKMEKASDSDEGSGVNVTINGKSMGALGRRPQKGWTQKGWTMSQLAENLAQPPIDRPILDRTRLAGIYKIKLAYTITTPAGNPIFGTGDDPDVFTAVRQQLGLKLEERKESIEMLMVDRLEKPDAN